ncbi:MAG: ATP-binding response regulator [Bacteroidota bacterium]
MITILIISIFFQLVAVFFSIRLIFITKRYFSWILIAIAITLMAIRRLVSLNSLISDESIPVGASSAEYVALAISILISTGIILIEPVFKSIKHNEDELQKTNHELEKAKKRAEEGDRLKSSFLANMSHEIRSPINGIMGFSQMLQRKEYPPEKRNKFHDIIHSNTKHLLNIINDLLDVSKIDANQLTLRYQNFDLNQIMQELYRGYKYKLKEKEKEHVKLQVYLTLDDRSSYIYSDLNRFRQIMENLLSNAIKFTNEGIVEFGYDLQSETSLLFYVKDTGIGLSPDEQEYIFDRFRQVEDSMHRMSEGTGLGLSISINLVELLGGEMWIESTKGEGSTFYFTLPYESKSVSQEKERADEEQEIQQDAAGKTLLIIEDDPTSLEYIKELLEPYGFELIQCETGEQGYQSFNEHPDIDLILMDIKLPDINGLELTRNIRSFDTNSEVPIIAQTAYAMSEDAQKSIDAGCDDYISKPIDKKQLLAKMSKFI